MGDTGGRKLIFAISSVDQKETQSLSLPSSLPEVFSNSTGFSNPPNFSASFCKPIKTAKVISLVNPDSCKVLPVERYEGKTKPVFIQADILLEDIAENRGESTNGSAECRLLAQTIRDRGYGSPKDDCGHIIAQQFGGKMVDYNLFPQNMQINRGRGVWSRIWKFGIELLIRIWLIVMAAKDPMVRFRVFLIYPAASGVKPDRPRGLHYHMEFYLRERKEEKETEEERRQNIQAMKIFIKAAIAAEVPNSCLEIDGEKTKAAMSNFCSHLRRLKDMTTIKELRDTLDLCIVGIEQPLEVPKPPPLSANKPFSWWDLVPVVGSVRTLGDAVRCGETGDTTGAAINTVLGVGGLALDMLSLGTVGVFTKLAAKEASKTVVKEVVKEGAKTAVKNVTLNVVFTRVFVIAATEAAKEGLQALAQTVVVQAARRAVSAIAEQIPKDQ